MLPELTIFEQRLVGVVFVEAHAGALQLGSVALKAVFLKEGDTDLAELRYGVLRFRGADGRRVRRRGDAKERERGERQQKAGESESHI